MTMNISIFDIPLITDGLCQYLSCQDLARCANVSKDWYFTFSSFLWQHPKLCIDKEPQQDARLSHLERHSHTVRSLQGNALTCLARSTQHPWLFPRIRSLNDSEVGHHDESLRNKEFNLLANMTTLQTLVLNDRFDQVKDVLELVKALRSLSALKRFELNGGGYAACHVRDIIMACCSSPSHQFETLHLKMAGHQYSNSLLEWGNKGVVDSLINMPATHILDLNIKLGSWHLEKHILIPLLGRCPLLERLCIDVECEGTTAELTQFFQSGKCRKIKHLSIGAIRTVDHDYHYDDLSDDFVHTTTPYAGDMDLIQSLGKGVVLTEGEVVPAAAPRISRRGLESLAVHRGLEFFDPQQDSLIVTRLHGETLLHLDLKRVGMEEFSSLVHGLPKLQSLKAEVVSKRPYALHHHPSQFLTLQWACQSLTKLDLFLSFVATGGVSSASILENNSIMAERILDSMTSQIGEMKQLRELQLKVKSWDVLKLEHGHLDRLSGLRRLQTLEYSITPEMSTCWGVEQAEWMLNHWPCLVAVVLKGKGTTRFQEIMLAERPWMCIRQS